MVPIRGIDRFFAFSLALLMFITSASFVLDMHFCQGQLKSVNFFGKAKNCHEMAAAMSSCPHHQNSLKQAKKGCAMEQKGCCQNKTLTFQADQDQERISSEFTLNIPLQQFAVAWLISFGTSLNVENSQTAYQLYRPPLISRDIYVLHESFLL